MNFKKEYEKAFKDISAGDDFKRQLEKKLNKGLSSRRKYTPYMGMLAAAAALALMVGAVYFTGVGQDSIGKPGTEESLVAQESSTDDSQRASMEPGILAEGDNKEIQGQSFSPSATWCSGVESDAEKYELFVELLGSNEVEVLYASPEQGFDEEDVMNSEEIAALAKRLDGAVPAENVTESNVKYYKAVLTNDTNIVFQIWNEELVRIAGVETIYQISK